MIAVHGKKKEFKEIANELNKAEIKVWNIKLIRTKRLSNENDEK